MSVLQIGSLFGGAVPRKIIDKKPLTATLRRMLMNAEAGESLIFPNAAFVLTPNSTKTLTRAPKFEGYCCFNFWNKSVLYFSSRALFKILKFTMAWTIWIFLKLGGDVALREKLKHTKFQVDISNGVQMARV